MAVYQYAADHKGTKSKYNSLEAGMWYDPFYFSISFFLSTSWWELVALWWNEDVLDQDTYLEFLEC
jgi:hypothetical protein